MTDAILILAAAEPASGGNLFSTFGIEWKLIVAQAVNFALVAFVLWKGAFKKVVDTMDERQHKIAEGLQFAEEAKTQLAETERRQSEVLKEANAQAQAILHEARVNAQRYEEEVKAQVTRQMEEFRRRGEETLERERHKMLAEVRAEVARLVVLTSAKVLQRELPGEEKSRLDRAAASELARLN